MITNGKRTCTDSSARLALRHLLHRPETIIPIIRYTYTCVCVYIYLKTIHLLRNADVNNTYSLAFLMNGFGIAFEPLEEARAGETYLTGTPHRDRRRFYPVVFQTHAASKQVNPGKISQLFTWHRGWSLVCLPECQIAKIRPRCTIYNLH